MKKIKNIKVNYRSTMVITFDDDSVVSFDFVDENRCFTKDEYREYLIDAKDIDVDDEDFDSIVREIDNQFNSSFLLTESESDYIFTEK